MHYLAAGRALLGCLNGKFRKVAQILLLAGRISLRQTLVWIAIAFAIRAALLARGSTRAMSRWTVFAGILFHSSTRRNQSSKKVEREKIYFKNILETLLLE